MKHSFIFLSVLLVTSSALAQSGSYTGPFGPGNYSTIPGGTFELNDPLTPWFPLNNAAGIASVIQPPLNGMRVGEMSSPFTGGYAMLNQVSGLVVGRQYVLSTFMGSPDVGGSVAIDVGNYGGQAWNQAAGIGVEMTPNSTDRWHFAFITFTADNPSMMVRLVRNGPTIPAARNYFDDVAITELGTFQAPEVVPEPATLAVFGAGALALIRRRRGK